MGKRLINISGQEAADLGLGFSTEKLGIMVFNDTSADSVSIQHAELPRVKEHKYLGVWITEGDNYLKTREEQLEYKRKRNAAITGYNIYEVGRGMWKGVMFPGLTFTNAVPFLKSDTLSCLKVNQRTVGHLALGTHRKTTDESRHLNMR